MRVATLLTALALTAAPSLAMAAGCGFGTRQDTVRQCAEGQIWDMASQSCVAQTTS